jgi:hypothetical protein
MRTVKRNSFVTGLVALAGGLVLASGAQAAVTTTNPAGLVIFPKLLVDLDTGSDTILQLSNTSDQLIRVRCYLVNANSHCSNDPTEVCSTDEDCGGGFCLAGWNETDFRFTLTKFQPIAWRLSDGLQNFPLDGLQHTTQDGQFNADSNIPPAPEDPFTGELKCFQVDEGDNPVARNDLKGEATLFENNPEIFDVAKYNAVGLKSTEVNDGNDTLCLGGTEATEDCPEPEYAGCPNVLILNHFFDNAPNPSNGLVTLTNLTLVPCSEDFLTQTVFKITVQMLIFNEFEQRLSTSRRISCLEEFLLSNIDTRETPADNASSIFNIAVQGTLAGQTRLRSVQTTDTIHGTGIVGVATEGYYTFFAPGDPIGDFVASDAFNIHEAGVRTQGDVIRAPRE